MGRRAFLKKTAAAGLAALPAARIGPALSRDDDLLRLFDGYPVQAAARARGVYSLQTVPLAKVKITDRFWRPRMEANRNVSLGHCFQRFADSDAFSVSKLVEAAAYMLTERSVPSWRCPSTSVSMGW